MALGHGAPRGKSLSLRIKDEISKQTGVSEEVIEQKGDVGYVPQVSAITRQRVKKIESKR